MKKAKFLMIAAVCATFGFGIASCNDDDDDNGIVVPSPEVSDFGGNRLVSVGGTNFSYNTDGTLRQIEEYGNKLVFDYSKSTVTGYFDGETQTATFTTDKNGYVTGLTTSISGMDEGVEYKADVSWDICYNAAGHITEAALTQIYTDVSSKMTEVTDIAWKLTWNGDLLTAREATGKTEYSNGEEPERWNSKVIFSYDNAIENRYMQYTEGIIDAIDFDGDIESPMFVGLLGKGPSKYPSEIENIEDQYSEKEVYEYTLNDKGLLEREKNTYLDYSNYIDYTYSSGSRATVPAAGSESVKPMRNRRHISLFGRSK